MPELATSDREIIIFYNPDRAGADKILGYATGEGFAVRDVNILKNSFTGVQLEELSELLHTTVEGMVNKEHPLFRERYGNPDFSENDWIKILKKNPELIREPIAVRGDQAIFVKTPSDLSRF